MKIATRTRPSTRCWMNPCSMFAVLTLAMKSGSRKNTPIPRSAVMPSIRAIDPRPSSAPSSSAWMFALRMSQRVPTTSVSYRTISPPGRGAPPAGVGGGGEGRSAGARLSLEALLEALNLTGRVNDRLLAREERVAVAAYIDAELGPRRTDGPFGPAGPAVDLRVLVLGMNLALHWCSPGCRPYRVALPCRWSPLRRVLVRPRPRPPGRAGRRRP